MPAVGGRSGGVTIAAQIRARAAELGSVGTKGAAASLRVPAVGQTQSPISR